MLRKQIFDLPSDSPHSNRNMIKQHYFYIAVESKIAGDFNTLNPL